MICDDDLLNPKRNNFTLVRLVLASSVIYTHSYWLVNGVSGKDDLSFILGDPISAYAVDGFFFLSGFLVYPSLLRLGSSLRFFAARLTRLWPALAASVLLSVLVGLFLTGASPAAYWSGPTAAFIFGNLSLVSAQYHLTGIMCGAEPCVVNGSLWTLPWEARCYLLLGILGAVGLAKPKIMAALILPATFAAALIYDVPAVRGFINGLVGPDIAINPSLLDRLWTLFAAGIAAYIFRHRIRLSWAILLALLLLNIAAHRFGFNYHVQAVFIGYAMLCFGFLTARNGAVSGTWPDYSYGMYIYAFPIMMLIHAFYPTDSYLLLALLNLIATLPVAALSWHYLEKPALDAFRRSRSRAVPQPLLQP